MPSDDQAVCVIPGCGAAAGFRFTAVLLGAEVALASLADDLIYSCPPHVHHVIQRAAQLTGAPAIRAHALNGGVVVAPRPPTP